MRANLGLTRRIKKKIKKEKEKKKFAKSLKLKICDAITVIRKAI